MLGRAHRLVSAAVILLLGTPAVVLPQKQASQAELERARTLVLSGKPADAIPIYENLLTASPHDTALFLNLLVATFKAGRYERVIQLCSRASGSEPLPTPALLFLGASYYELARMGDAVEPLTRFVTAQPAERNARLMLGEALLASRRFADSLPHLEYAAQLLPDNPRVWYALQRSYRSLAGELRTQLDSGYAGTAYWHAMAGDSALRTGRHGLALRHYREALAAQPGIPGVHASIASVYRATAHADWAAVEQQRENQTTVDCGRDSAVCAFRNGDYVGCVRTAANAGGAAGTYWATKAYTEMAEKAYSRLKQLPPSPQLHELRARELDDLAQYRDSAQEWREAIALAPADKRLKQGLAIALLNARDLEAALPVFRELAAELPQSAEVQFLCGRTLLELGRPADALVCLQRSVTLDSSVEAAQAGLGEALLKTGRAKDAVAHLQRSLPSDEDGTRHFQLARALQSAGDTASAGAALRRYRELQQAAEGKRKEIENDYPITAP